MPHVLSVREKRAVTAKGEQHVLRPVLVQASECGHGIGARLDGLAEDIGKLVVVRLDKQRLLLDELAGLVDHLAHLRAILRGNVLHTL